MDRGVMHEGEKERESEKQDRDFSDSANREPFV